LRQVVLQTAGRESRLTEPGQLFVELGFKPWAPVPDAVIGELVAGGPAERAGMQSGDRVLTVDGIAVDSWAEWVELVRARPGQAIEVSLLRGCEKSWTSLSMSRRSTVMQDGSGASALRFCCLPASSTTCVRKSVIRWSTPCSGQLSEPGR
jgi:hypothetical protein